MKEKNTEKNKNNIISETVKKEDEKIVIPLSKKLLKAVLLIITFTVVLCWVFTHFGTVKSTFYYFVSIITPFTIGLVVAYIVNTAMNPLERLWDLVFKKRKKPLPRLRRAVCLVLAILIVLGIIFAVFFMLIPELMNTVKKFADSLPTYATTINNWYEMLSDWLEQYNFEIPEISISTTELGKILNTFLTNYGSQFLDKTVNITSQILSGIVNLVLGLVVSVYLLAGKEKLISQSKTVVKALLSEKHATEFIDFASLCNDTLSRFVNGQLIEAVIIGVLCFLGMLIFNMPYAWLISIVVAFTALIPVFGAFFGTAVGAVLILLEDPMKAVWFVVFIIVLQQIEGNLIYPKVVGKSVGLPGIWVLLAVTIGGNAFGLIGMLFGVPVCSVLYCTAREFIKARTIKKR